MSANRSTSSSQRSNLMFGSRSMKQHSRHSPSSCVADAGSSSLTNSNKASQSEHAGPMPSPNPSGLHFSVSMIFRSSGFLGLGFGLGSKSGSTRVPYGG